MILHCFDVINFISDKILLVVYGVKLNIESKGDDVEVTCVIVCDLKQIFHSSITKIRYPMVRIIKDKVTCSNL